MNPFREVFNLLTDDSLLQDQSGGDIEMVQRPGGGALALNQIFIGTHIYIYYLSAHLLHHLTVFSMYRLRYCDQ